MAKKGTFDDRIRQLSQRVGSGKLTGEVIVDQVYAKYQELRTDLKHPRGGQAKALESSLFDTVADNMQHLANELLDRGPEPAMQDNVERIAGRYARLAPVDISNLRQSAHPRVLDQGEVTYDRMPTQRRLSEAELKAMRRGRR